MMTLTDYRTDPRGDVLALLAKMRSVAGENISHQRYSDQMEMLVRTYLEPTPKDLIPGLKFSRNESRIIARLLHAPDCNVTVQQLMDAVYFDCMGDEPEEKIISVFVCRLRKKLQGSAYRIENVWGRGFRIVGKA